MPLQLDDLAALNEALPSAAGQPLLLALDLIDEDPAQPRTEFDALTLQELADTIAERGVRQPVSVRPHPQQAGRWMLNFGARRLRASKLAGRATVPAFVDQAADSYDQMIENEQREPLKPLELALFVKQRLSAGETQAEIARRLGKSRTYITYATAMIDAPEWLMTVYREGRCKGLRELHELRQLHDQRPAEATTLVSNGGAITRQAVAAARTANDGSDVSRRPRASAAIRSSSSLTLIAEFDGQRCEVIVDAAPPDAGKVYIQAAEGKGRRVVAAASLRLIGLAPR